MAIDKNIAAFVDTNAFTVGVRYQHSAGDSYNYITNDHTIKVGDWVIVPTKDRDYNSGSSATKRTPVMRPAAVNMQNLEDITADMSTIIMEDRLSVAQVVQIDDAVEIEPDAGIEYKWVVQKLDLEPYFQLLDRNKKLVSTVADAYKKNLRKSFAERIMSELADDERNALAQLLAPAAQGKKAKE
jgi:hypothetical protein